MLFLALAACRSHGAASIATGRELAITRVMADPSTVADDRGEWIEITNTGTVVADLRGWELRSANDPGYVVPQSVIVPPNGAVLLARSANAVPGMRPALVYSGIILGNNADWLVLRDPAGTTRDSLAWRSPPRGVAIDHRRTIGTPGEASAQEKARATVAPPATMRELVARVLDVGQGDAILIQNGGSTVLVDGGPDRRALARWLDVLHVSDTIDAVILTHMHGDHFEGLRELFSSRRRMMVREFWSNGDAAPNFAFTGLPDTLAAHSRLRTTIVRDTDAPCASGQNGVCTLALKGGAKLHVMRPMSEARTLDENDRSVALKLVGPDSASFTMWLAGDAEHDAIRWFSRDAGYARSPGMRADVLKANHHGSCDGVSDLYLELVRPSLVVASLGAVNDYGHMHAQAKAAYARHGVPLYRTDQNGTVTLRTPGTAGGGYTVTVERGEPNAVGPSDRRSYQPDCAGM
ncbi:MAG TPA: lamin tail domain-containing protein [Gemmatimonadaceae bacterium]|nr:lamin tail domain-containing protein [Gemmatimonadaceae bacterium]